eukprot:Gb_37433 [translate_table: standard]
MARPLLCGIQAALLVFFCVADALVQAEGDLAADTRALLAFKDVVGRHLDWNQSLSACNWTGIRCFQARVVSLTLPATGLRGQIPENTIGNLSELRVLRLRLNNLSGSIPRDLSKCGALRTLYLQDNQLSSPLPSDFSVWPNLIRLNLAFNRFNGSIPPSLNNLTRLGTLFLENNSLTGSLPALNLSNLVQFNVSNNNLSGTVPSTLQRFPRESFLGNTLCNSPLKACVSKIENNGHQEEEHRHGAIIGIVVGAAVFLALIIGIFVILVRKKGSKDSNTVANVNKEKKSVSEPEDFSSKDEYSISLQEPERIRNKLVFFSGGKQTFSLEDLLRASAEVLGRGSVGTAYKAVLELGTVVVVKRIKDVDIGHREFAHQIGVVGKMSHENLVSLRAYFFSNDEKLLVYDYMPMGSLSALLHGNRGAGRSPLSWETRVRIALGAAKGIAYLHEQGSKISHGNIKSSNILLTKDYDACVSDFGLLQLGSNNNPRATKIVGYRAPEVRDTRKTSQKADVYSFGVLLLELLTGKAPTQASLSDEGVDLPRWVQSVVREEWTAEVFDVDLMRYQSIEEEMLQLLQVGMACVAQYPDQRPTIHQAVKMIKDVSMKS